MMPVAEASQPTQADHVDYKKKYKTLKRKLRFLLYEHECFLEELRKAQRKLLKVSRDKSFLLDRLLQYEKVDDSSSDSDATASSDSDAEANKDGTSTKKKKAAAPQVAVPTACANPDPGMAALLSTLTSSQVPPQASITTSQLLQQVRKTSDVPRKKPKVSKKAVKQASLPGISASGSGGVAFSRSNSDPRPPGHMTREELERHLELKQSRKPQFMSIEKAPHSLPDDIFSNENSNPDSDLIDINMIKEELIDDTDLIIDVPMD